MREIGDENVAWIAESIGALIAATATAGEVLVSSTVRDLVAGSGLRFEAASEYVPKGIPDPWRMLAVAG